MKKGSAVWTKAVSCEDVRRQASGWVLWSTLMDDVMLARPCPLDRSLYSRTATAAADLAEQLTDYTTSLQQLFTTIC